MVTTQSQNDYPIKMTEAEYLAFETESDERHEFVDGQIYAMAGAKIRHAAIVQATGNSLMNQLREEDCIVVSNDVRVKVDAKNVSYRYPDVIVICGEPNYTDNSEMIIDNPKIIIEVLSPSTAVTDYNAKRTEYMTLESVQEYLIISQDEPKIDRFLKQEGTDDLLLTSVTGLGKSIELPSVGCTLTLADVYEQVTFEDAD